MASPGWRLQGRGARIWLGGKKRAFGRWKQQKSVDVVRTGMKESVAGNDDGILAPKATESSSAGGKKDAFPLNKDKSLVG